MVGSASNWGIVAKALDGQRYPLPLCEHMLMCDGERGSRPEGADDLCLVGFEALGLNSNLGTQIPVLRLKSQSRTSKLTKYTSTVPLGPLPFSPSYIHIRSHRGNGYR